MLRQNAMLSKVTRRKEQHRELLLARIGMDASLLLGKGVVNHVYVPCQIVC